MPRSIGSTINPVYSGHGVFAANIPFEDDVPCLSTSRCVSRIRVDICRSVHYTDPFSQPNKDMEVVAGSFGGVSQQKRQNSTVISTEVINTIFLTILKYRVYVMSDLATTSTNETRDVTELIRKTWCEGPLRLQVSTLLIHREHSTWRECAAFSPAC
jgi:hypothetical protein